MIYGTMAPYAFNPVLHSLASSVTTELLSSYYLSLRSYSVLADTGFMRAMPMRPMARYTADMMRRAKGTRSATVGLKTILWSGCSTLD